MFKFFDKCRAFHRGQQLKVVWHRVEIAKRLAGAGDHELGIRILQNLLPVGSSAAFVHFHLGEITSEIGDVASAIASYENYLSLDPKDHLGAWLKLALLCPSHYVAHFSDCYLKLLFDQYASSFERSMYSLSYQVPELIADAVLANVVGPIASICDLGCGTGLSSKAFQTLCACIEGVDISAGMLKIAAAKNIYHALHCAPIVEFLSNDDGRKFDLIIAADVFVYFPTLEEGFRLVSKRLVSHGHFTFSYQMLDTGDFVLEQDQRCSHSQSYIGLCCTSANLQIVYRKRVTLRLEHGNPVLGEIIVCVHDK